jgi:hypothetical protein
MHIYPLHDLVMTVTGGICGAAIAIAVMDVKRTLHASPPFPKIAVGTPITERSPHRSERARFGHSAPTSGA